MRRMSRHKLKEQVAGYLFILPNFLGVLFFVILPLLFSFMLIFADWDYLKGFAGLSFAGLDNLKKLINDDYLWKALKNNFILTGVTVPSAMAIGMVIAVLLNRHVYVKGALRTMFFLPYVSNLVAVSVVWSVLYNAQDGPINAFLRSVGIDNPPGWLGSTSWALPAIIVLVIWTYVGYTMVLYMAGLQGIPKDLYEAASIDGATGMRQFFKITVPMLQPTTFLIAVTLIISTFQVFAVVNVMTQGGPINSTMLIAYHIYLTAFQNYKMGYAAAMSWVLFVLIFSITLLQWRSQKKWQQHF